MDLSKAFDTLNHDLLLAKLNAYGFDKQSLLLIKSYLTNRCMELDCRQNQTFRMTSRTFKLKCQTVRLASRIFKLKCQTV